jgi:hypothetical protein
MSFCFAHMVLAVVKVIFIYHLELIYIIQQTRKNLMAIHFNHFAIFAI